ncbi:hypothetical protein Pfo_005240, partial [Paulownia fortunei]
MLKKVTREKTDNTPQQVEHTPKQVEVEGMAKFPTKCDNPVTEDLSDEEEEVQTQESLEQPKSIVMRRPRREIHKPARFADMVAYALSVVDDDVLSTFQDAVRSSESEKWKGAM